MIFIIGSSAVRYVTSQLCKARLVLVCALQRCRFPGSYGIHWSIFHWDPNSEGIMLPKAGWSESNASHYQCTYTSTPLWLTMSSLAQLRVQYGFW